MPVTPDDSATDAARSPPIAVVGNDAVIAARPASAVQLAHALRALGFDAVLPASWGDELVSAAALEACAARGDAPAVLCACPHVGRRLLARGAHLGPFLVPLVSPPVAAARYLRRAFAPARPRIVYIGACPAAVAPELDERLTPDELASRLAEDGISLLSQPKVFESVVPPDRRRTLSLPGGVPTAEALHRASPPRALVVLDGPDYAEELAQQLLAGETTLVDVAPALGCACSGVTTGMPPHAARGAVIALEPPRSTTSAVELTPPLDLGAPLPPVAPEPPAPADGPPLVADFRVKPSPSRGTPVTAREGRAPSPPGATPAYPPGRPEPRSGGRLRSPALGVPRFSAGAPPVSRTGEGRALPRAYVAHRRPAGARRITPRGTPVVVERELPLEPVAEPTLIVRTLEAERSARDEEGASLPPPPPPARPVVEAPGGAGPGDAIRQAAVAAVAAHSVPTVVPLPSRSTMRLGRRGLTITIVALGLAVIGLALATRDEPTLGAAVDSGSAGVPAPRPGLVESTRGGQVAPPRPAPRQRATTPAPRTTPRSGRAASASPARPRRTTAAATSSATDTGVQPVETASPVAPPPRASEPARAEPARPEPAPVDSAAEERAAIQREIDRRRARLDSIARVVDSLGGRRPPP